MAATTKVTFTLDDSTLSLLSESSARLQRPKSEVVRQAIHDYYERLGKLNESEKTRMLHVVDEMLRSPSARSAQEVDRELREIRKARRAGGRKTKEAP